MSEHNSWTISHFSSNLSENTTDQTYFFAYYCQFNRPTISVITVTEILILSLTFLSSITANGCLLFYIIRYRDVQTVRSCFVLNLIIADLLFAATIPAVVHARMVIEWTLGDFACRIMPFVQAVSGVVLLWTLAVISIDRYRCIVVPPYRSPFTPRHTLLLLALIWLSTTVTFLPILFFFRPIPYKSQTICTFVPPSLLSANVYTAAALTLTTLTFTSILPMAILIYHYQRILHKIISTHSSTIQARSPSNRRQSEISISDIFVPCPRRSSMATSLSGRQGTLSQHEEHRLNKHVKVVRILLVNVVLVVAMWLPIVVVLVLVSVGAIVDSDYFVGGLVVAFLGTVVVPLAYGDFRREC